MVLCSQSSLFVLSSAGLTSYSETPAVLDLCGINPGLLFYLWIFFLLVPNL